MLRLVRPDRGRGWVVGLLCLLGGGVEADAASLQVSPTTLTLSAQRHAEGVTLHDAGTAPVYAQVRVFRWFQVNGEDRLEQSDDLAVSPPMLKLPPGGEQLIRVVRQVPLPATQEASYRLIVDELPMPGAETDPKPQGLHLVLRYSIPVFIPPASGSSPALQVHLSNQDGKRFLEIANPGNGHAQIADLDYLVDNHRTSIAPGLSGYVLPGQTRRWPLPADLAPGGSFRARMNGEPDARALELDR